LSSSTRPSRPRVSGVRRLRLIQYYG
jgi:hypothetical protein